MYASLFLQRKKNFSDKEAPKRTAVFEEKGFQRALDLIVPWIVSPQLWHRQECAVRLVMGRGREPAVASATRLTARIMAPARGGT